MNRSQGGREQYYRMDESDSKLTLADRLQVIIKINTLQSTLYGDLPLRLLLKQCQAE